ncbi:helix-turn-helix transcriptional regulator [Kutzneria sp. CA-103260]|uniref:helix-turn-helix transcriptional regulator n=1 Tax=Kutzneria sp. CA-103260 TaxID=2802641 RepID=UPI001BA514C8|nr:LuxR family transcriptional regulator [Kutzneria sp. CA-103260]QUQ70356.1 HTH-type transcriptional regulator MalT [Kutzneria sp. CA-103260]
MDHLEPHLVPHRVPARPLVGRAAQLAQLTDAAAQARTEFRLVEVVGEPGTGKSRLLAEFTASRPALRGRAAAQEQDVPFAPLVDALVDQVDATLADRLSEPEAQLLATVFPVLSKKPATDIPKARLYRAMRSLLRALAVAPTVVVLDDMHWADESTVELVDYLVRHPLPAPVLLVVAHRPHQVSFRLSKALAEHAVRVDLGPLSAADAQQLLGPMLSQHARDRLYEDSGGNPFYLDTLARMRTQDDHVELPEPARATLAAELAGLAETEALVAKSAAVVGDTFEPSLIAHVAEVPEHVVLQAFDDLVARDVLREVEGSGRFRFRHSLVRHVAYNSAAAGWRHGAHARIAAYLAKVGAPAARRAEHVLRSAKYGDQEAVDTLTAAARAVATHQPATAAAWFEAALHLSVDDDVRVRAELAFCQGISGRIMPALETFGTALRGLPPDDRAWAASFASLLAHLRGEYDWARLLLTAELNRQPDPDSEAAAPLRLQLVLDAALRGDVQSAKPFLDAAPSDDRDRWTVPFAALDAYVKTAEGNRFAAVPAVLAAARLVDASDDDEFLRWLPAIHMLGWAEVLIGEHRLALRHFTKSVTLARENGHLYFMPQLLHGQSFAYVIAGRTADGLAAADEALESTLPQVGSRGVLQGVWCQLNSWRGQHASAIRAGRRAVAKTDNLMFASFARNQLLLAQVHAGNYATAVEETLAAAGGPELPAIDPFTRLVSYALLAKADALDGNHARARQWAQSAGRLADERLDLDLVFADLAWAYADGDADKALTAAAAAERIGMPLWEATARLLAGTCLARDGHRDQALRELQAASAIFNVCEATELHTNAVREQRRLGVRVPHTGALANTLSPRELDVAELVCAGSTNQQIAEKLVLSVRTVETHLTHIFAKLGVTNRAGVARVLASQAED